MSIVLRTLKEPYSLLESVRTEIGRMDPYLPIYTVTSMSDLMRQDLAAYGVAAKVITVLAALALDDIARRHTQLQRAIAAALCVFVASVTLLFWQGGVAPMRISPAVWYLRAYADPPTQRAFRYFHQGKPPGVLHFKKGQMPELGR